MILTVEDNPDIRLLFDIILRSAGYEVVSVSGGNEAMEVLERAPTPELIVLDVQMPDLDGWETLRAIRARPDTADVPVVMCTVKARPVDQARGWELGCDGYLTKPFDVDEVLGRVREVIARSPEERAAARRQSRARLMKEIQR
jgi:DNA-binding response OmpR family regulator